MASFPITLPALPSITPPLNVGAVLAAAPVALVNAEADALPLPFAQALPTAAAGDAAQATPDGAAMRPDQVFMARQLLFPAPDAPALAAAWRSMVRTYGAELASRGQQARAGQVSPALLAAAQDGRVPGRPDRQDIPADTWRFTVHTGAPLPHRLQVVADDSNPQQGHRHRRAALRLELELADGTRVMVLAAPVFGGVALELYAPDAATLARLRELQPVLEAVIVRAGLRVQRWKYLTPLPPAAPHASMLLVEAANALNLSVFRAMAELALLLPGGPPIAGR